jgi:PiT family inorganic phosphate transporter
VSIGVPVSITQALVGAIFGTGIASGFGALRIKTVRNILIGWVVTPSTTAILAIGFHFIA